MPGHDIKAGADADENGIGKSAVWACIQSSCLGAPRATHKIAGGSAEISATMARSAADPITKFIGGEIGVADHKPGMRLDQSACRRGSDAGPRAHEAHCQTSVPTDRGEPRNSAAGR